MLMYALPALFAPAESAHAQWAPRVPWRVEPPVFAAIYTADQSARGSQTYASLCTNCHFPSEHTGHAFASSWNGRTVSELFQVVSTTMPQDNPGTLTLQQYVDVVAYLLRLNGYPAGKRPLRADSAAMSAIRIGVPEPARPPSR
jgi:mono/diheme cytochrome c family protein